MSKNLFDFATKELSQDAFLCWLISNLDDKDVYPCSKEVLNHMFKLAGVKCTADDISDIDAKTQINDIDIVVDFKVGNESKVLVIEDKTTSDEHNQLDTYNKVIKNWPTGKSAVKIFFKPDYMFEDETNRVKKAKWEIFSFDDIYKIFNEYRESPNLILRDYSNHICNKYKRLANRHIPKDPNDLLSWVGFFRNTLEPALKGNFETWSYITRYNYAVFGFRPLDNVNGKRPYVEIRQRDIIDNKFNAKILIYGAEDYISEKGKDEFIKSINKFKDDKLIVLEKNPSKQFSHSKEISFNSEKEFVELLKDIASKFMQIMHDFDNTL